MTGEELIAAERQRQIDAEGWTEAHDDEHREAELVGAAIAYAKNAAFQITINAGITGVPSDWPNWDTAWWKPSDDPIRNLVKAGALIAAEIDRLQRANAKRAPMNASTSYRKWMLIGVLLAISGFFVTSFHEWEVTGVALSIAGFIITVAAYVEGRHERERG